MVRIAPDALRMRDFPETRFHDNHTDLQRHGSRRKYLWFAAKLPRLNAKYDRFEPNQPVFHYHSI